MSNSLVSIIIPTYNRAHLIGDTLDSVLSQTYSNWECIVVDDGSTDETELLLHDYIVKDSRFQYHKRSYTYLAGGNGARNYGLYLSKGDYIQWFDSDDVMHSTLIAAQMQNLIANKKRISICLLDRYNEDFSELLKLSKEHDIKHSIYCDFILRKLKAHLPTTFFRRDVINKYKFNEYLKKSQEVEFLQRIFREHENDIYLSNSNLVKIRRHGQSITSKYNIDTFISILEVKLLLIEEFPKDMPKIVFNGLKYAYLNKLKIAFANKSTRIYLKYLFKLKYLRLHEYLYFVILYFNFLFFNKGMAAYEAKIRSKFL